MLQQRDSSQPHRTTPGHLRGLGASFLSGKPIPCCFSKNLSAGTELDHDTPCKQASIPEKKAVDTAEPKPRVHLLHWLRMRFDLVTIFPEFFAGPLDHGILRRARETGLVEVNVQDLRVFTKDRHRTVDDRPFG